MKNFHLSFVLASIVSIVLVACGEKVVEVASVSISQPSADMEIGETLSLKATVSPSNASYDAITWTSAKPQVASVSASGLVSAISEGNTTITVTAGGKAASCSVTVVKGFVAVSAISLNKTSLELVEDDTETLTATVSPDDATDKTVSWTSSNEDVAKVKDGTVTAIKEGNANITANTPTVIFCLTFNTHGLSIERRKDEVTILENGSIPKFVPEVRSVSFSASRAFKNGQRVLYVTERCVFELCSDGLCLKEVYPGVDIERDVLSLLPFKVRISPDLDRQAGS